MVLVKNEESLLSSFMYLYLFRPGNSDNMSSVSFSSEELQQLIPEMQSAIELNDKLKDTMYFM